MNRIQSPEIKVHLYGQLVFDTGGKNIQCRKNSFFNKRCWGNQTATCKRMKLDHFLNDIQKKKKNPQSTKDLNIRPRTINLLE